MLRPYIIPPSSLSSEAVRAALLLRPSDREHARRYDLHAGDEARDPLSFHCGRIHAHLLRDHAAVDREGYVAAPDLRAARKQRLEARARQWQRHHLRKDIAHRRRVAVLDPEHLTQLVLRPQRVL